MPRGRLMKRRAGLLQGLSIAEHCHRLCSRAATPEVRRSRLAHRLALKDTNALAVVDFVEVEALLEVVAVAGSADARCARSRAGGRALRGRTDGRTRATRAHELERCQMYIYKLSPRKAWGL